MTQALPLLSIHRLVWIALLAALSAVGALIAIPLGPISPVPVTLQTMFVLLCGLILGPKGGAMAILLYIAAGCLGIPVFAGGKAGLAVLVGPTGGFLTSFLPAAMLCGLVRRLRIHSYPVILLYCAVASMLTLVLGSLQLMQVMHISMGKAMAAGLVPFLPGAALKCVAAAAIHRFLDSRNLLPI